MNDKKNMTIGGIIAEYNIFHNGHKYQIDEFKRKFGISHLVVVISGNFTQRGGPSIIDKYSKTRACLDNGVDLVLELPTIFSTQTAEIFSRGAVMTLDALSCVDYLCFGSENGNISELKKISDYVLTDEYNSLLKSYLDIKLPFPQAREKAIYNGIGACIENINKPNNILGIEYLKELRRISSKINPVTIKRQEVDHNSTEKIGKYASATSIRKDMMRVYDLYRREKIYDKIYSEIICEELLEKNIDLKQKDILLEQKNINQKRIREELYKISKYLPSSSLEEINKSLSGDMVFMSEDVFSDEINYSILDKSSKLTEIFEVVEGLENSVVKSLVSSNSVSSLVAELTSKRYSSAKIRRMLYNILLDIDKEMIDSIKNAKRIPYIRVLGLNSKGGEILKKVKKNSEVYIIDKTSKVYKSQVYKENFLFKKIFDLDIKSSNMYYKKYYKNRIDILKNGSIDMVTSPIYKKDVYLKYL